MTKTETRYLCPVAPTLGLLFVALKLTHVVAWPWLWVLAPFWIPLAAGAAIFLIILAIVAIAATGDR